MSALFPAVMAVALVLGVCLLVLLVGRRRQRIAADPLSHPRLVRLNAVTLRLRWVGVGIGLLAAMAITAFGKYGIGFLLAPAVLALVLGAALLVGEVLVWRDARTPGVASLESRRPLSYLPLGLGLAGLVALVTLAAVLVWCLLNQDDDPSSGTFGRGYLRTYQDGFSIRSPFPGQYYSLPLGIVLGIGLVLALVAVAMILLRPRNGSDPVVVQVDDAVRRRSAEAIGASALLGLCGSLVPVSLLTAMAVNQDHLGAAWALALVGVAALLGVGWAAAVLIVPGGAKPATS